MKLISFIIPCYRSENTIASVCAEIGNTISQIEGYDYEIVLVNDCSPDDTFKTISALAANDSHITAVDLAKNFGQHAALIAAFHYVEGEYVIGLDDAFDAFVLLRRSFNGLIGSVAGIVINKDHLAFIAGKAFKGFKAHVHELFDRFFRIVTGNDNRY